ncbi:hypothetical protein NP493_726g01043 [Ridgeia piscesae]|uniref:Suppressor of fused homolog n=1 Tax=Ridgeia piscesae TaxID=27915 RepID=A0AAD9KQ88_RIDPI|nr:hypothetical protein NP493_726g01043 [Ridgeia piscesae]
MGDESFMAQNYPVPVTPPGLQAIYTACRRLYPSQPNPLQVTALVKYCGTGQQLFPGLGKIMGEMRRGKDLRTVLGRRASPWEEEKRLGGPDPLDYISMYSNPGAPERGIPPHWHYVSFGLSDLHGDERVHGFTGQHSASGYGFELTFRLRHEPGETAPPTWPAALMQALARYVFKSENSLCVGDHVPWHSSLDGSESRIQHMLMTDDVQLQPISTPFGSVNFVQIVGVCSEELKAAQHWNGTGILDLLKTIPVAGGPWLITDMRRGETIFETEPQLQDEVERGIEEEGSNLSGVTSRCSWEQYSVSRSNSDDSIQDGHQVALRGCTGGNLGSDRAPLTPFDAEQIKATLQKGLSKFNPLPPIKVEPLDKYPNESSRDSPRVYSRPDSMCSLSSSDPPIELLRSKTYKSVHLQFNLEAASLLPLALRGRLKHGRHFTFKSVLDDSAITLVSSNVIGSIVNEQHPYAAHGSWLQVLLPDDFIDHLHHDLSQLSDVEHLDLPKNYHWVDRGLVITVLPDEL